MNRSLKPAGEAVRTVLTDLGVTPRTQALFAVWEKEAGRLTDGCHDVFVKGDILYVEVTSPVYIQELMLRKHELTKKINGHFSEPIVKAIRFVFKNRTEKNNERFYKEKQ